MTDATCGLGGCSTQVQWSQHMDTAFQKAKMALSDIAVLAYLLPHTLLSPAVVASEHQVGHAPTADRRPLATPDLLQQEAEQRRVTLQHL